MGINLCSLFLFSYDNNKKIIPIYIYIRNFFKKTTYNFNRFKGVIRAEVDPPENQGVFLVIVGERVLQEVNGGQEGVDAAVRFERQKRLDPVFFGKRLALCHQLTAPLTRGRHLLGGAHLVDERVAEQVVVDGLDSE